MKRKPVTIPKEFFPEPLRAVVGCHEIYASSCSPDAEVWLLKGAESFYLKTAAAGSLQKESEMASFFNRKQLGPEVMNYLTEERDWLLTRAVPGEDCTFFKYLANPKKLSETTAILLRQLHEQSFEGCPVPNHRDLYLDRVRRNYQSGYCDLSLFPEKDWGFSSKEEAWNVIEQNGSCLQNDTLLHGDYCLPNVLLDHWNFSGFVDVGRGGVGDRHTDLFWGVWTLFFNLKTNAFCSRFLDAYGRDRIEPDMLRLIAACELFL